MASRVEQGLGRLLNISFERAEFDHELAASLAGEYVRRVAIMSDREKIKMPSPFFNPLELMSIHGASAKDALKIFELKTNGKIKNAYLRRACECYLQWCEGIDSGNLIAAKYPELFDPLIELIEIGGEFGLHHGELLVGGSAVPLRDWMRFANATPFIAAG